MDSLASRSSRLLAVLIDVFIQFIFLLIVTLLTGISTSSFFNEESGFDFSIFLVSILSTIIFHVLIPTYLWNGQTIGKRFIKIAVVKVGNEEVNMITMIIRSIFTLLSTVPFLSTIVGVIAFIDPFFIFRKDKRTLHDFIAKTKVIDI